jgi:hypothetical protein
MEPILGAKDKKGFFHGDWVFWDPETGSIEQVQYRHGRLDGKYLYRSPNEDQVIRGRYKQGDRSGIWSSVTPSMSRAWFYHNGVITASIEHDTKTDREHVRWFV